MSGNIGSFINSMTSFGGGPDIGRAIINQQRREAEAKKFANQEFMINLRADNDFREKELNNSEVGKEATELAKSA